MTDNRTTELRVKRLRELLDERGIEHYDHENGEPLRVLEKAEEPATSWRVDGASYCAVPDGNGTFDVWIDHCTPEQAIAATLGSEPVSRGMLTAEQVREAVEASTWAETSTISEFNDSSWQAIADELNAELGGGNCVRCAEDMGRYADSLCDPLKERIAELLRCLENDWHIHASWDGLRKFWCIELTEEGVRMRDAHDEALRRIVALEELVWFMVPFFGSACSHECGCPDDYFEPHGCDDGCKALKELNERMKELGIEVD